MGKIFNALEKYRKENKAAAPAPKLKKADWDALLQYDRRTGKLDLRSTKLIRDPGTIHRLLANKMILPDGKITSEAKKKCKEMTQQLRVSLTGQPQAPNDTQKDVQDMDTSISSGDLRKFDGKTNKKTSTQQPAPSKVSIVHQIKKNSSEAVDTFIPAHEMSALSMTKAAPKQDRSAEAEQTIYDHGVIDKNLISLLTPQSFESEQFKLLRTHLLFPSSGKAPRSILVTSAVPGEGKSFVAANLAVSIASDIDRHVLLMDCDLRNPVIHRRFGIGDVTGLSDYLSRGTPLSSLLIRTKLNKLTILPAGRPPANPSELLSSELMSALISEVAERYYDRLIIIDSPPPTLTAETIALARNVDGILVVVKFGDTSRKLVRELIEKMGKEKILGSIINFFDIRSSGYHTYKAYRKYEKRYKK